MKKNTTRSVSALSAGILILALALGVTASLRKTFTPASSAGLTFEVNDPSYESIVTSGDNWILTAGGRADSTHYARIKYKLPEQAGVVLTEFYAKLVFTLPTDFYTKQHAGFRILNTDNITAKLSTSGATVGALNANELRYGLFLWNSDKRLHLRCEHETKSSLELWKSSASLPVGQHIVELYGDISKPAPWYLRIDGKIVAAGNSSLCPLDTAQSERVITRVVGGIDGAADQDANSLAMNVSLFEIADHDPYGSVGLTPTATQPIPPTVAITNIVPSVTPTATPAISKTPTVKPSAAPTATPPAQKIIVNGTVVICPCIITVP